jgi:hypothetical protein
MKAKGIGATEPADLDDAARGRRVNKGLDPGQAHVVGAAVGVWDHRVGFAGWFVMQSGGEISWLLINRLKR